MSSSAETLALSPLRPREFFAEPWSGVGAYRPPLLGRIWSRRFRFSSRCEFESDTTWTVHDVMEFENGRTDERSMEARMVAPDRIRSTAPDMPDGLELILEERGFRFEPYRLAVRVGPLPVRLRCRDRCRLDADGVLHDHIRLAVWRLPVGEIRMQLRRRD